MTKIKYPVLAISLACILLMISLPLVAVASGSDNPEDEINASRVAGQTFITSQNATTVHAKWQNTSLGLGQTCYNLKNEAIAYLFPIVSEGKIVGRIVVGGSAYNYHVLEASQAMSPPLPSVSELKNAIQRDIDIQVNDILPDSPELLYLGYCRLYASYEAANLEIAFDLWRRNVTLTSKLEATLTPPEQYSAFNRPEGDVQTLSWPEVDLSVPPQKMCDYEGYQGPWQNDCGPTSGAMISEYYKEEWGCAFPNWQNDHDELFTDMNCNVGWPDGVYPPSDASNGFIAYADRYGYAFNGDSMGSYSPPESFFNDQIKPYIDNDRPIMILFYNAPYAEYHWCAIRGYGNHQGTDSLYVNNPWYDWGPDYVDWGSNWAYVSLARMWPTHYYTLTVSANGNGSVSKNPDLAIYVNGTTVQLVATPDSGRVFYRWEGEVADIHAASTTTSMNSDKTVIAYFIVQGDATGDGVVDAVDITKVERIIVGLDPPTDGADANLDYMINAIDLTKVERIIAELDFKMGTPPKPKSITTVATVSVDAPARVLSGSDFTAYVTIAQVTDLDATNWDVVFDPEVLRLDDVTYGTINGVNIPVEIYNEIEPGRFTVVQNVPNLNGVTGSGNLAILHFHVLGTEVQTTDITLSEGVLSSILAEGIEATWTGDSVLICPPPTVRAKLQGTRPYPAGFQVPLTLRLYDDETELNVENIMTAEWLYEYTSEDEEIDIFEINQSTKTIRFSVLWDCPDDVYHVTLWDPHVPHSPPYAHTLINLRNGVTINPSQPEIDMSTLQEGNPNGDEQIAIGDYTLLLADYGATPEDEENWHDGRCDFDHTLWVSGSDYSLLSMNYGEYSPVVVGEGKLGGEETFTKVDMSLKKSEDTKEISAGGTFTVTIEVACKEQKVDAIDAFLAFDPECLEVVSVKPGNALVTVLANRFDNAKGTITLGIGRDLKADSASGSFTLGTIEFKAKKAAKETRIGFEHKPPRKTDVAYHGESLLGTATDLILEIKP